MEKKRLSDISKKEFFTTPTEYFNELENRIQTKINQPAPSGNTSQKIYWMYAAAASLVIAVLIFVQRPTSSAEIKVANLLEDISNEDCREYLFSLDIDPYDMVSNDDTEKLFDETELPESISDETLDLLESEFDLIDNTETNKF